MGACVAGPCSQQLDDDKAVSKQAHGMLTFCMLWRQCAALVPLSSDCAPTEGAGQSCAGAQIHWQCAACPAASAQMPLPFGCHLALQMHCLVILSPV